MYRLPTYQSIPAATLLVLLAACASTKNQASALEEEAWTYPAEAMAQQSECVAVWEALLNEWERNGGGVLDSVAQIRSQIETDQRSQFAELVRKVWASQDIAVDEQRVGDWPVSAQESRRVIYQASEESPAFVPEYCQVPIYLDNWWNERLMDRRLADMPPTVEDDTWPKRNWIQYWLFVRTH